MTFIDVNDAQLIKLGIDLSKTGGRIGAKVSQIVRKTAYDIEADAKVLAPVDTGALRSSISVTLGGDGRSTEMSAEIGPTVEYGVFQELGTSRMAAQPFLAPAFDRRLPGFEAALGQAGERL